MLFATVRQRKIHVKKPDTVIQNGVNVDWLKLEMDDEWAEMDSIVCVFVNQYTEEVSGKLEKKEVSRQMLHTFGKEVRVPWECLEKTGTLSVSCTGYVDGEKVMTTMYPDSYWNVVQNGPVTGGETLEPTPSLYNQILAAAGEATAAAIAANQAKDQLLQDAANGLFDGADGKNAKVSVGDTQTGSAGSDAEVYATGTEQNLILNFVIPRGRPGDIGPAGPQGPAGPKGETGERGQQGEKGETGATGPQGEQGDKGEKGDPGSAGIYYGTEEPTDPSHPVWVNPNGQAETVPGGSGGGTGDGTPGEDGGYYTPSVTQVDANTMQVRFSASKTGMPSVAAVNVTLPAGPKGPAGADGAKGDKGDTGDTGPAGADGKTPVKGTDYFTEADKNEMVNAVIAALPVYNGEVETA